MKIAVVIVSYRSEEDLGACLEALAGSDYTDFRVVIRENGGGHSRQRLEHALPTSLPGGQSVTLLPNDDNLGFAGGVNACLHAAKDVDAYWILNPDTVPEPDTLRQLVACQRAGDHGIVGHDLILPSGHLASRGGCWRPWLALGVSIDHGAPRNPRPAPGSVEQRMNYVIGASMLVTRDLVERVGDLREDYFLYCEEVEWCLRARDRGESLGYCPEALVLHRHGASTGGGGPLRQRSRLAVYLQERNRLLLTRDLYHARLPAVAPLALLHLLARYGRGRAWRQLGYAFSGWMSGIRDERGPPRWLDLQTAPAS